jgi:hypothetical protein
MPGIGATDPADLEAQARAELGFSLWLEQPRRISPYPGIGGSGGYAVWYREQQLQRFNAGEAMDVSRRSIYRWADCLVIRQIGVMFHLVRYFFSPSSPPTLNAKATERSLPQGASRACCLCCYPQFAVVVVSVVFVFFRCLHRRRRCVRCRHRRRRFFRWIF